MAQIAITALSFDMLSRAHWIARSFFLASLVAGCISVYYAMHLIRVLGALISEDEIKSWLVAPVHRIMPGHDDKRQPSLAAVLILDTPKSLIDISVFAFLIGLSIYVLFVWVNKIDTEAGKSDSLNVFIVYIVTLWLCVALYHKAQVFDYYSESGSRRKILCPIDLILSGPWILSGLLKSIADILEVARGMENPHSQRLRRAACKIEAIRHTDANAELPMNLGDINLDREGENRANQSSLHISPSPETHPHEGSPQLNLSHSPSLRSSANAPVLTTNNANAGVNGLPFANNEGCARLCSVLTQVLTQNIEAHRQCADTIERLAHDCGLGIGGSS